MLGIRRLQRTMVNFGRWLSAGGPELDELVQRSRAAAHLPAGHKKDPEAWGIVANAPLDDALRLAKHLPDPCKRNGRPRGPKAATAQALLAMREHLDAQGGTVTAAARHVLTSGGLVEVPGLRHKADHLAKAYRHTGK